MNSEQIWPKRLHKIPQATDVCVSSGACCIYAPIRPKRSGNPRVAMCLPCVHRGSPDFLEDGQRCGNHPGMRPSSVIKKNRVCTSGENAVAPSDVDACQHIHGHPRPRQSETKRGMCGNAEPICSPDASPSGRATARPQDAYGHPGARHWLHGGLPKLKSTHQGRTQNEFDNLNPDSWSHRNHQRGRTQSIIRLPTTTHNTIHRNT